MSLKEDTTSSVIFPTLLTEQHEISLSLIRVIAMGVQDRERPSFMRAAAKTDHTYADCSGLVVEC